MERVKRIFGVIGKLLYTRGLPVLTLAILFGVVAVQFDKRSVNNAPASDFINYTAFDVQNARAGEDVYFKVCRDHKENYVYAGALTVYVYRDVDPTGTQTKVYAKDIGGSIRTQCENKVLRASDFSHSSGTYKMAFCVNFKVKYDIEKTACKESNIYKIYPQPTDVNDQLKYYQQQIENLNKQMQDNGVNEPSDLRVPSGSTQGGSSNTVPRPPTTIGTPAPNPQQPTAQQPTDNSGSQTTPPPEPQCTVNLLGIRLFC
jgi:hypothetical protein